MRYYMPVFPLQNLSCCQYFHSLSLTITKSNEHKHWKCRLQWISSKPQYGMSDVNAYGTSIAFELKPTARGSLEMQTAKLPAM